ncbi:MAG: LysE family transporter [Candidatus Hermodarchaeota archaeon]
MANFIEIWIMVAALAFSLAVPIGPINLEIIKQVLNKTVNEKIAWIAAVLTGIGAITGDFIIALSALTIGGEVFLLFFSNPLILFLLFTINILILSYLGISTLIRPPYEPEKIDLSDDSQLGSKISTFQRLGKQYTTGFSLVVTSPWSYLWWVSAGTLILFSDFNTPDLLSRIIIVLMFVSGVFMWIIFFCTTLSIIGRLPNPRLFHWITKGTASILLLFMGLMVIEAWNALLEVFNTFIFSILLPCGF